MLEIDNKILNEVLSPMLCGDSELIIVGNTKISDIVNQKLKEHKGKEIEIKFLVDSEISMSINNGERKYLIVSSKSSFDTYRGMRCESITFVK